MEKLALFDLDNTLLAGDSDYLWGRYLVERGRVDDSDYEARNRAFYEDYRHGVLDIQAYLRFQLGFLARESRATLESWREEFLERMIRPILLPKGQECIRRHREEGATVLIITATNRFVTEPIARLLGVDDLLATEAEENADGSFTGQPRGTPCFREGKIRRLEAWLQQRDATPTETWFYSDSRNDLFLLESVHHPVAVDADAVLAEEATRRGWPCISFR
ncbi:MAG: HAD family phosphatase [Magnetococcales bacterium]|nr:HAD family phosphatase [Magnetococcales bacterium]